jgi:hypothetical protein
MNERIKELADRLWRVHPSDIDAMGLKTRTEFYEHELKKFTELIVRECLAKASEEEDRFLEMSEFELARCMEHFQVVIKEHFGVE